jgi:hypothetical protein
MSRRGAGRPLRALLAADRGFTVTEALVAGFLLVLGSLAVIAIQSASSRNTYRAEQSQVVSNRLQDELEQIKQLPFEEIALAAAPDTSPDPDDPNSRVSGVSFDVGGGSGTRAARLQRLGPRGWRDRQRRHRRHRPHRVH